MHQMKPELQNYLVEEILNETMKDSTKQKKEYAELMQICQNLSFEETNIKKVVLRLMRMETNRTLVRAFISSLTEEERLFLKLKYKEDRELISISMELHVSVSQLSIWSKRLIEATAQYINYELKPKDIYKRKKIINMLEILATTLKFIESVDPEHQVVDKYWLRSIEHRYNLYRKLLNKINKVVRNHNVDMRSYVVYLQIKNPYASKADLAERCNIDKGTVSRYLIDFTKSMSQYLIP